MKQLSFLFVCISVVLSCSQPSPAGPHPNKIDTIPYALFRVKDPNGVWFGPILDTAIAQVVSKWFFEDSVHSKGHWITDTTYYGRVPSDTLLDALKRPLFDSLHHVLWRYIYFPIPHNYYQKVLIPMTK